MATSAAATDAMSNQQSPLFFMEPTFPPADESGNGKQANERDDSHSQKQPDSTNNQSESIKQNGMDLYSSLTMLHRVLQQPQTSEGGTAIEITSQEDYAIQLNENKAALLDMFQTNTRNIEMLSVSLEDLKRCLRAGMISEMEESTTRQALTDAFVQLGIQTNRIAEFAQELANCHSNGLLLSEELSTAAFQLYSQSGNPTFTLPGTDPVTKLHATLPPMPAYNAYGYPTAGGISFPPFTAPSAYSAPGYPFPSYAPVSVAPAPPSAPSAPAHKTSHSSKAHGSSSGGSKPKSNSNAAPKPRRAKVLTADDQRLLAEQVKKLMLPLPLNLPEQTHPPLHGRGFGASAKPFNADNSLTATLSNERLNWRCRWCYCSGKFTPALRKGPTGAKTLCNSCGMWFARRGTLPVERWREFANPSGLSGLQPASGDTAFTASNIGQAPAGHRTSRRNSTFSVDYNEMEDSHDGAESEDVEGMANSQDPDEEEDEVIPRGIKRVFQEDDA